MMTRFKNSITVMLHLSLTLSTAAFPGFNDNRSKQWLESFVLQPLPESPRKVRYLELIAENSHNYCKIDENWFNQTTNSERCAGREKTSSVGSLAFCYRTPGLPYYQDENALAKLRRAFGGVVSHVSDGGKFTWERNLNKWGYHTQQHEHAWRLEPLLLGYIGTKKDLPVAEASSIEAALKRAARWLYVNPKTEANNRGIVWASVLTFCGIYFEEPEWVALARKIGDEIFAAVISPDGEIGEHTEQYAGGGPDINYSYTSLAYLYSYRLWTGDAALDPLLEKAAHWLVGYNTLSQWPVVVGASVRTTRVNSKNYRDCLPFFERYSKADPFFAFLADKALRKVEGPAASPFTPGEKIHLVSPAIWAVLEAGSEVTSKTAPEWQLNRTEIYSQPNVHYALISRHYQTGIVFRARSGWRNNRKSLYRDLPAEGMPLRGLQTWAWGNEDPIILHGDGGKDGRHSFTEAGGVNTAKTDISRGPDGWEVDLKTQPLPGWNTDLATIVERRQSLWTLYAFTPVSTVLVYGGLEGAFKTQWFMNPDYLSSHSLDASKQVCEADGREGRLYYLNGTASSFVDRVDISAEKGPVAFGFSNGSFRFEEFDPVEAVLNFSDSSGRYRIELPDVLKNGNIDRKTGIRLRATKVYDRIDGSIESRDDSK